MIDFVKTGLEAALRECDLGLELGRHAPDADPARLREVADAIAPFLRGIVDALGFVMRAARDMRAGRAVAFANGQILCYLLDDRDLLPEQTLGLLGLLDDAYLVHHHAGELLAQLPWLESHTIDYQAPTAEQFDLVRQVLPEGVGAALTRTSRTVVGIAIALIGTRPGTEIGSQLDVSLGSDVVPQQPPRLRLRNDGVHHLT